MHKLYICIYNFNLRESKSQRINFVSDCSHYTSHQQIKVGKHRGGVYNLSIDYLVFNKILISGLIRNTVYDDVAQLQHDKWTRIASEVVAFVNVISLRWSTLSGDNIFNVKYEKNIRKIIASIRQIYVNRERDRQREFFVFKSVTWR